MVPVEVLQLVPVGAHTKLLEGEQTHTFWVRIHCRCGIVCLLCSLLGRWSDSKILFGMMRPTRCGLLQFSDFPGWLVTAQDM